MNAFAIDLGGTHATCALIKGQRVVAAEQVSAPAHNRLTEFLPTLSSLLRQIGSTHPEIESSGIGLGLCGLVDCERQRSTDTDGKFVDAKDVDLAAWAMRDFGLPLRVENDARRALLGKHYAGAAQGIDDVAMFTLGTLAGKDLNFKNLFDIVATGDTVAQQLQQHCFKVWAMAALGALHVCDPSLIVFGGGVAQSGHVFIQDYVARYAWVHWGTVPVRASKLGNQAGLIGAVPLLTQEM